MQLELLLIDMGGVLLDMAGTQGLPEGRLDFRGREALLRTLEASGARACADDLDPLLFAPWKRDYAKRYERGVEASWNPHLERLCKATGYSEEPEKLLSAWFRPYAESVAAFAGVARALDELDQLGVRKVLVSNVPLPGALYRRVLDEHGLSASFESLLFSYDEGHRKPSPAMLRRALERFECLPKRAVMIGDRCSADGGAARAAGTFFLWIRSAYDGMPRPDWIIDEFRQTPRLVRNWAGG